MLYLLMIYLFSDFASDRGELSGWKGFMQKGWGVSSNYLTSSFEKFVNNDFVIKRKERSDKGVNIFSNEKSVNRHSLPLTRLNR